MSTIKSKEDLLHNVSRDDLFPMVSNDSALQKSVQFNQLVSAIDHVNTVTVGETGQYESLSAAVTAVLALPQFTEITGVSGTITSVVNSNVITGTGTTFIADATKDYFIEINGDGIYRPILSITDNLELKLYAGTGAVTGVSYKIFKPIIHRLVILNNLTESEPFNAGDVQANLHINGLKPRTLVEYTSEQTNESWIIPSSGIFIADNLIVRQREISSTVSPESLVRQQGLAAVEGLLLILNDIEFSQQTAILGGLIGAGGINIRAVGFYSNNLVLNYNCVSVSSGSGSVIECDFAQVNNPTMYGYGGLLYGLYFKCDADHLINNDIVVNNPIAYMDGDSSANAIKYGAYRFNANESETSPKNIAINDPNITFKTVTGSGIRIESNFNNRLNAFITGGMIRTNGTGKATFEEHGDIVADHGFVRVTGTLCLGDTGMTGVAGGAIVHVANPPEEVTANYKMVSSDDIVICSGTITVDLPEPEDCIGKSYTIKNVGTGVITIQTAPWGINDAPIDGSITARTLTTQWEWLTVTAWYFNAVDPAPDEIYWAITGQG